MPFRQSIRFRGLPLRRSAQERRKRRFLPLLMLLLILAVLAVSMTNTGVAQTLMSLTPVLILWPSRQIFGKKVSVQEVVGAVIAVAGASLFFL